VTAPYTGGPDQQAILQALLAMLSPADATAVQNRPAQQPQRSVGPAMPGNSPLPEATVQSQHQPRYDKAMNLLADLIPVLGSLRGVGAGHEMAQAGNPFLGALTAAASLAPEGGNLAKQGIKSVAVHAAGDAEREALARMGKSADRIMASVARDNLDRYAPTMYHETNIDKALTMLGSIHEDMAPRAVFMSDAPEMALGQGNNRGVRFEFDASKLAGRQHGAKPGLAFTAPRGGSEFVAINNKQQSYMDAVKSIIVSPHAFASNRGYARRFHDIVLPQLVREGWTSERLKDGSIRLMRGTQ
jgi:hypothetical protein